MEIIKSGAISVHLEGSSLPPFIWVMWSKVAGLWQAALAPAIYSRDGFNKQMKHSCKSATLQHKYLPVGLSPFLLAQAPRTAEGTGESYCRLWTSSCLGEQAGFPRGSVS